MEGTLIKQSDINIPEGGIVHIRTVQFDNGTIQTMAINRQTCMGVENRISNDIAEHKKLHQDWVNKYTKYGLKKVKEIKIPDRYKKFATDYVDIVRALQQDEVYRNIGDSGSSNWSTPVVYLNRCDVTTLQAAISELSSVLRVAKGSGNLFGAWYYLSVPSESAKGQKRDYQAKYIAQMLLGRGYKTTIYYGPK